MATETVPVWLTQALETVNNHCNYTEATETVPVGLTQTLETVNNHYNCTEATKTVPVGLTLALEIVNNHCNYTETTELVPVWLTQTLELLTFLSPVYSYALSSTCLSLLLTGTSLWQWQPSRVTSALGWLL